MRTCVCVCALMMVLEYDVIAMMMVIMSKAMMLKK